MFVLNKLVPFDPKFIGYCQKMYLIYGTDVPRDCFTYSPDNIHFSEYDWSFNEAWRGDQMGYFHVTLEHVIFKKDFLEILENLVDVM